jgi:hypothetical protein
MCSQLSQLGVSEFEVLFMGAWEWLALVFWKSFCKIDTPSARTVPSLNGFSTPADYCAGVSEDKLVVGQSPNTSAFAGLVHEHKLLLWCQKYYFVKAPKRDSD